MRIIRTVETSIVLYPHWHVGQLLPSLIIFFVDIWRLKSACIMYFFWNMMLLYWVLASWRSVKRNGLIFKGQNIQEEWPWILETWGYQYPVTQCHKPKERPSHPTHCKRLKPDVCISFSYIAASCLLLIFALSQIGGKGQWNYLAEENMKLNV